MRKSLLSIEVLLSFVLCSSAVGIAWAQPDLRPFPEPLSSSRTLPYDVDNGRVAAFDHEGYVAAANREFDIFSWQTFLALNWPAGPDGAPDPRKTLADTTGERVWSFWRPAYTVFRAGGETPQPWGSPGTNAKSLSLFKPKAAWRQHDTSANENFQAFSGPLVDQNGKWVRYSVLINREEFEYLVKNTLYSQNGQIAFSQRDSGNDVDFPADDPLFRRHGAVEIKFAWKELGPKDDRSRFFVRHVTATLSEPAKPGETAPPTREYDAGLVGMHLALRTRSSPEWVWATFEQVDNTDAHKDSSGNDVTPNFSNPKLNVPVNVLPSKNAKIDPSTGFPIPATGADATTWIESLTTQPVQVQRVVLPTSPGLNDYDAMLAKGTEALNTQVQAALRAENSVFQYYRLVATQWPIKPNAPLVPGGAGSAPESVARKTPGMMVPVFLVNTTMETYFQKDLQQAGPLEQDDRLPPGSVLDATMVHGTESCVGCHFSAGIAIGFKGTPGASPLTDPSGAPVPIFGEYGNFGKTGSAHFSWLLQLEARAKPLKKANALGTEKLTPADMSPAQFLAVGLSKTPPR